MCNLKRWFRLNILQLPAGIVFAMEIKENLYADRRYTFWDKVKEVHYSMGKVGAVLLILMGTACLILAALLAHYHSVGLI